MRNVQLTIASIVELETLLEGEMLGVGHGTLSRDHCRIAHAGLAAVRPLLSSEMCAALEYCIPRLESWLAARAGPEASPC